MPIVYLLQRVPKPAGGHAVICAHVASLRRAGFDARIVFGGEGASYYEALVEPGAILPLDEGSGVVGRGETWLVIPEADLIHWSDRIMRWRNGATARLLVLNQNHFYTFSHGGHANSRRVFDGAVHAGTSKSIVEFLAAIFPGRTIPLVPVFVDTEMFKPATKIARIAYMPRKMPGEFLFIREVASRLNPALAGLDWTPIDQMAQADVAAVLNHSLFFLALGRREGFGLPALEAMASGCVVVGFTGGGGDEYAAPDNGYWAPDDDLCMAARLLAEAVADCRGGRAQTERIAAQARARALAYSRRAMEAALMAMWGDLLSRS